MGYCLEVCLVLFQKVILELCPLENLCSQNKQLERFSLASILAEYGTLPPVQLLSFSNCFHAGVLPSILSYHSFCVQNWVCKRPKAFSHAEDMKKSAGGLQSNVSPWQVQGRALVGDHEAKHWEAQCILALRISYFSLKSVILC